MPQSAQLTPEELVEVAQKISELLGGKVKFAVIGGAACSLVRVASDAEYRGTSDLDLVIQPNKSYNAEVISNWLVQKHPKIIRSVEQFGVRIPAIPIYRGKDEYLVEIEIFDVEAWPNRQQYNIADTASNPMTTLTFSPDQYSGSSGDWKIPVMHPVWLLREKILSQYEREGSVKERTDISDLQIMLQVVDPKSLVLSAHNHVTALQNLMAKRPDLINKLRRAIVCYPVFGD
ncbi:hypothetical protein PFICI_03612 [Pestalotiopsis fici W106-1]|uniref:Uncharacterized protein n=1 Tax=Pestalotiopsis fici (strain W106-1 / CGMCC3.15140) TaxID=1229662 RepID=W3XJF3_PESFW|nr:uncharacterized protein PFICI_03612 [Pestalotiopsis fici W106-1]ETS85587.1 hypothetical protein PFICI_03612 [Pestalotiopsis fici W106-1]